MNLIRVTSTVCHTISSSLWRKCFPCLWCCLCWNRAFGDHFWLGTEPRTVFCILPVVDIKWLLQVFLTGGTSLVLTIIWCKSMTSCYVYFQQMPFFQSWRGLSNSQSTSMVSTVMWRDLFADFWLLGTWSVYSCLSYLHSWSCQPKVFKCLLHAPRCFSLSLSFCLLVLVWSCQLNAFECLLNAPGRKFCCTLSCQWWSERWKVLWYVHWKQRMLFYLGDWSWQWTSGGIGVISCCYQYPKTLESIFPWLPSGSCPFHNNNAIQLFSLANCTGLTSGCLSQMGS